MALKQLGFNPFAAFIRGHAFVGAWLNPEDFPTTVVQVSQDTRKGAFLFRGGAYVIGDSPYGLVYIGLSQSNGG